MTGRAAEDPANFGRVGDQGARARAGPRANFGRFGVPGKDRGSATVLVLVHLTVLLVLGAALGAVAAVVVRHRAAQAAADLAALAAATRSADGGCAAATDVARANGARVTECLLVGPEAEVEVAVPPPAWPPGLPELTAEARAGPG